MEIKNFIKEILINITEAIEETNKENNKYNFWINENINDYIDFDLAIISKKDAEGKIGAEIFDIGVKIKGKKSEEIINRIKFRILPYKKR